MSTTTIIPPETIRENLRGPDPHAGGRAASAALRLLLSRAALWRDPPPREVEIEAALLRSVTGA